MLFRGTGFYTGPPIITCAQGTKILNAARDLRFNITKQRCLFSMFSVQNDFEMIFI